jgi:hypothetical protein
MVNTSISIEGTKPTLEYLRRYEPDLYKRLTRELRTTATPLAKTVANTFPASSGMKNWDKYGHLGKGKGKPDTGHSFPRYVASQVRKGVKVQVGGRKNKGTNSYPLVRIKQTDGAGQIYDLAREGHSVAGRAFVKKIDGQPSRVMWKAAKPGLATLKNQVAEIINRYSKDFTNEVTAESIRRAKLSASSRNQVRDALGRFGRMM